MRKQLALMPPDSSPPPIYTAAPAGDEPIHVVSKTSGKKRRQNVFHSD